MTKEYVGMAIWFKGRIGAPDMCVAVDRDEWLHAAKSQANKFGYSVAVDDTPYPSKQAALFALELSVASGQLGRLTRVHA